MTDPVADPARRHALEQQLAVLRPVARILAGTAMTSPRLPDGAWRGPAADACRERDAELAARLGAAAREADEVVRRALAMAAAP